MKPKKKNATSDVFVNKKRNLKVFRMLNNPSSLQKLQSSNERDTVNLKRGRCLGVRVLKLLKGKSGFQKKSALNNNFPQKSKNILKASKAKTPQKYEKKITTALVTAHNQGSLKPKMNISKKKDMKRPSSTLSNRISKKHLIYANISKPAPRTSLLKNKNAKTTDKKLVQPIKNKFQETNLLKARHHKLPLKTASSGKVKLKNQVQILKLLEKLENPRLSKPVPQTMGLKKSFSAKITENAKKSIFKDLVMQSLLAPKDKTVLENKLLEKIDKTVGLETKKRIFKSRAGKANFMHRKEIILRGLHDMGVTLPEGRTASEKSLIAKIKLDSTRPKTDILQKYFNIKSFTKISHRNMSEQKAKPLKEIDSKVPSSNKISTSLTEDFTSKDYTVNILDRLPLNHKTLERKQNKLRRFILRGFFCPEKKTVSNTKLDVTTNILGLPAESVKPSLEKGHQKVTSTVVVSKKKTHCKANLPSTQKKEAEVRHLYTPTEEIITNSIAAQCLTSDCKAALEEQFPVPISSVPKPKSETRSIYEMYDREAAVSALVPIESLTLSEKETVLRTEAELGIPLKGKNTSERIQIFKVKAEAEAASEALSEEVKKIKAAGLLSPFRKQSRAEKALIIREVIRKGLPLLKAKTASEKRLISKVRADLCKSLNDKNAINYNIYDRANVARALLPFLNLLPEDKEPLEPLPQPVEPNLYI